MYDGRVNKYNPCPKHFSVFFENEKDNVKGYEGIVNIQTLKSKVKCVIIHTKSKKGDKTKVSCCFSTDINMPCGKIIEIYKLRFQIEFLFRDAKQFTGLTQCQARSEAKINTHINASLTAVSLAKALDLFKQDNTSKKVFSMHSLKMRCFNENYIDKIFSYFKENPKIDLNNVDLKDLREYGCIAA